MKTKLLLILLFFSITSFAQTNLLPNGDFESWSSSTQLDNWYRYSSGLLYQSTTAQNGLSSTKVEITTGTFNYFNSEYFPVEAGKTYRVTLYHKVESGSFTSLDFSLYNKPGTFKQEIAKKTETIFSTSNWSKIEFDYTSPTSQNIEVDVWVRGATNSNILIDNVSVVDLTPPAPQYTLIPDINFENKLISLNIDSGTPDGKVLTSSVSAVTTLNITNGSIVNLSGIEDFINLTDLNCNSNKLTNLDLSKNIALKSLKCFDNQISSINISKNILLTYLHCDTDYLTTLDVSNNTQLTNLMCVGRSGSSITRGTGKLTSLNVSKNTLLTNLDCSSNQITALDVSQNTALKTFNCSANRLTSLAISTNTLLTSISCGSNDIQSLDFSNNVLLKTIRSSSNKLTSINVSKNVDLTDLECNSSLLTNLDVSKNIALTRLMCGFNNLSSLNLKNGKNNLLQLTSSNIQFWGNSNLKCIEVDDVAYSTANWSNVKDATAQFNTDCRPYTLITDINFEKKLISLNIDSGTPDGKVLTSSISSLTTLNVANSSIADLSGIEDFANLTDLNCSKNLLTSINLSQNTKLINLSIGYNTLTALDVTSNVLLKGLDCQRNSLTDLNVSKNIQLTGLNAMVNKLSALDVSQNTLLTTLYITSNKLTALNIDSNKALIELNCGYNTLTSLNVSNNTLLTSLVCHYNQISSLNVSKNILLEQLMCHLNELTSLDVSNNPELYMLDCLDNKITKLDISKNPKITELACENNQLNYLNLKNGNNINLDLTYSSFLNNPNLTCIQVDDVAYSNSKWSAIKDATANFNIECFSYTSIPDINFENKLIALGIDSGTPDGKVLTSKIDSIKEIDLFDSNISDLTGIQDFIALSSLSCAWNKLTTIDLSQNINLTHLYAPNNKLTTVNFSNNLSLENIELSRNSLTSLNVSSNINLKYLTCQLNQLSNINVTNNKKLNVLSCSSNLLTDLDLSKNTSLYAVMCSDNKVLLNLNLQNGRNNIFLPSNINLTNNPSLTCILVDDALSSTVNWSTCKDASASYSTVDCSQATAIPDSAFEDKLIALNIDKDGKNGSVLNTSISAITSLDVSSSSIKDLTGIKGFTRLSSLNCSKNLLTDLDLSQNIALSLVNCNNNSLVSLNLKNGNNKNFDLNSNFTANPNLRCILVDDDIYTNVHWAALKDITANYNVDCNTYTLLPDSNFENKLIDLKIDKDGKNGKVLSYSISQITSLDVADSNISDLTGLEDFTSLIYFFCDRNKITSIDLSKNIMLENIGVLANNLTSIDVTKNTKIHSLEISKNQITSVDLSKNTNLKRLGFENNKLTEINLTNNKELWFISGFGNQLTSLDLSQNKKIEVVNVDNNLLKNINLQNGNNENFLLSNPTGKNASDVYTSFLNNPGLTCIQVDNVEYSNAKWANIKDASATYVSTCKQLGLEESVFDKAVVYPNPTKGEVNINNIALDKVTVYNTTGQLVKSFNLDSGNTSNSIDLSGLPKGVYYLYLINQDAASAKKVIIE